MLGCAGLLLSSLALHMAAPGGRLVPEPLTFASALLSTAMPQPATAVAHTQQWLLPSEGWASLSGAAPPLNLAEVLQSSSDDVRFQPDSFRGSLLQAALGVVSRASEVFAKLLSFPELFAPAAQALNGLGTAEDLPQVSHSFEAAVCPSLMLLHVMHVCKQLPCKAVLQVEHHITKAPQT